MLSSECCEILKSIYFEEHLRKATSTLIWHRNIRVQSYSNLTASSKSNKVFLFFRSIQINHNIIRCRSSHQSCSIQKGVLRNFTKFTVKQLCQSLFFNICLRPATLWKKRFWQIFSCEFYEISKNTFFTEHPWWLLLQKEKR